jgi:hypothetical protein
MSIHYKVLPSWTWAAGQESGTTFDLKNLPRESNGTPMYLTKLFVNVKGTVTTTSSGTTGNVARCLSRVQLALNGGMGYAVDVPGSRLARIFRAENYGRTPPAASAAMWTGFGFTGSSTADPIDATFVVEFGGRMSVRDADDTAIPVPLLHASGATFTVKAGALTDMSANASAASLTVTVTAVLLDQPVYRIPPMPAILTTDLGALLEPSISAPDGLCETYILSPQGDGPFLATTDIPALGFNFGSTLVCDNGTSVSTFYRQFNQASDVAIDDHTATDTDRTAFLPLLTPVRTSAGQRVTHEAAKAKTAPHYVASALANPLSATYRVRRATTDAWFHTACGLLGLDPTAGVSTGASGKPTSNPYVPKVFAKPSKGSLRKP